jgi:flagellar hook-associated protein 1 FlgK
VQSTFGPIELGKRGIIAHTLALETVGHNMSNAGVEGYTRQRVEMQASPPLYAPQLNREEAPGQIGQGVEVSSIQRLKDMLLEGRIVAEGNVEGYWDARDKYILMLEQIYNEPTDSSVRTLMDRFWEAWQELSLRPTETGAREAVLERGKALIDGIHDRFRQLKDVRDSVEGDVKATVAQVNDLTTQISSLNGEISKSLAMGDNPNDLLDQRDRLVNTLSSLIDITVNDRNPQEYVITSGGMHIVQGKHHETLDLQPDRTNEGYSRVVWPDTEETAVFRGGKIASLIELRDGDVRNEVQNLDLMTVNFIDMVNDVHKTGNSLNGETGADFFVEYPFVLNAQGNYDANGDGTFDSTYVFRVTGTNTLDAQTQIGLAGTLTLPGRQGNVEVRYFPTDTVQDLIARINLSGSEVVARLDFQGKLALKGVPASDPGNPDFVIRGLEDSGQFLVGYAGILKQTGAAGAYTWTAADGVQALTANTAYSVAPLTHPAGWIEVNPRLVKDPGLIAAGAGQDGKSEGPGDGSIALAVARLRTQPVMVGFASTFDGWFADRISSIGLRGEEAGRSLDTVKLVMKNLIDMRESISGVNMDEEISKMLMYQRGYQAVARYITTFDSMLDVIINRMGVLG